MYPDMLMPVQGASLSTTGMGSRRLRTVALTVAAAAMALSIATPRIAGPLVNPSSLSPTGAYGARQIIIQLCREGRAAEAVQVADCEIANVGQCPVAGD